MERSDTASWLTKVFLRTLDLDNNPGKEAGSYCILLLV